MAECIAHFLGLQDPQERSQAEQVLRVFGQSTEYIAYCKVRHRRRPLGV
jgi:hypothetical protein